MNIRMWIAYIYIERERERGRNPDIRVRIDLDKDISTDIDRDIESTTKEQEGIQILRAAHFIGRQPGAKLPSTVLPRRILWREAT